MQHDLVSVPSEYRPDEHRRVLRSTSRGDLPRDRGRGRGLFLTEDVKAGHTILLEEPAVIGPKQMSPLVRLWKGMSIILDEIWFGITGLCGVPCGHANHRGLQILH